MSGIIYPPGVASSSPSNRISFNGVAGLGLSSINPGSTGSVSCPATELHFDSCLLIASLEWGYWTGVNALTFTNCTAQATGMNAGCRIDSTSLQNLIPSLLTWLVNSAGNPTNGTVHYNSDVGYLPWVNGANWTTLASCGWTRYDHGDV